MSHCLHTVTKLRHWASVSVPAGALKSVAGKMTYFHVTRRSRWQAKKDVEPTDEWNTVNITFHSIFNVDEIRLFVTVTRCRTTSPAARHGQTCIRQGVTYFHHRLRPTTMMFLGCLSCCCCCCCGCCCIRCLQEPEWQEPRKTASGRYGRSLAVSPHFWLDLMLTVGSSNHWPPYGSCSTRFFSVNLIERSYNCAVPACSAVNNRDYRWIHQCINLKSIIMYWWKH